MPPAPAVEFTLSPTDERFLRRLTIALTVVVFGCGVLAIGSTVSSLVNFQAHDLPGVKSEADIATMERLDVAGALFSIALWSFLFAGVVAFWRRRSWSRRLAIALLALCALFGAGWGILLLLAALAGPNGEWTTMFVILYRLAALALGIGALGLVYLCWRSIKRLVSRPIARAFSQGAAPDGA